MLEKTSSKVIDATENLLTSDEYLHLHEQLVESKSTTGTNKSDEMVNYTMLNWQRTKRVLKTIKIDDVVKDSISKAPAQRWLLITEPWCGDASQSTPVIIELAKLNPAIKLDILLRDENLEIIDQFLTNGGRSIPKLIRLNSETNEVIADWGPRPVAAQYFFMELKNNNVEHNEISIALQNWYNKNKASALQHEIEAFASIEEGV